MGYDAYVRCNCITEGKTKPFRYSKYVKLYPEGLELELPEELEKDHDLAFDMRDEFYDWEESACEHEYMKYCSERIGNIAGMGWLRACIEWLGGEREFPVLASQLPKSNDGFMPTEYNEQFREDLDKLIKQQITVYQIVNTVDYEWSSDNHSSHLIPENKDVLLCENENTKLYSYNDVFRIEKNGEIVFQSSRFNVERIINRRFIFKDRNQKTEATIFFDLNFFTNHNKQKLSYKKETFYMQDELKYEYDVFMNLLKASKETGNPICWS